jgi:predicted nuclease of restriction endonuclease-like (RecB) superfamily
LIFAWGGKTAEIGGFFIFSRKRIMPQPPITPDNYEQLLSSISELVDSARAQTVRSVNALMTATYWSIGWHIIEFGQKGQERADYGEAVLEQLASDLSKHYGRGFSARNLRNMRLFYLTYKNIWQAVPAKLQLADVANHFKLPWTSYVRLLSLEDENARMFYEQEALRNGWSSRQLDRQISSQFYTRTLLSKNKASMLEKGAVADEDGRMTPEQEIKDPFVFEFLDLKDEYSESDLEQALIERLEEFLMELGGDFTFVGRQRRLRIDDEWFRVKFQHYRA